MKAKEMLTWTEKQLSQAGIEEAAWESKILLEWIFGIDRTEYYMNPDQMLEKEAIARLKSVVEKRTQHVPLQYLMGSCEFMGYEFLVDDRVLIPRQDTECLVEEACHCLKSMQEKRVLDLCCGSGCIGISIKKLCPDAEVTLADISADALCVAKTNAEKLNAEVTFVQGDLFAPLADAVYDCIVSNPPYIATEEIETLMPEVRDHEPRLALDGSEDGLKFYRKIVADARAHLKEGGQLLFEIGMEQGGSLREIFEENGYIEIEIKKDLAGLNRIAAGRWPVQG